MLNSPNRYAALVLLSITTFSLASYGQAPGPNGAPPGAGANGPPPSAGAGAPPSAARADDVDPPQLVKRPKLSDKAPLPAAGPRNFEGVSP